MITAKHIVRAWYLWKMKIESPEHLPDVQTKYDSDLRLEFSIGAIPRIVKKFSTKELIDAVLDWDIRPVYFLKTRKEHELLDEFMFDMGANKRPAYIAYKCLVMVVSISMKIECKLGLRNGWDL